MVQDSEREWVGEQWADASNGRARGARPPYLWCTDRYCCFHECSQKDLLVASCSGQTTNCSVQQQWQQEGVRDSAEQCTRLQTDMQALERWPAPKISRRGSVRDIERRMSTIVPRLVGEALGPRHAIEGFRLGMDGGGQAVGQIGGKGRGNKGMLHGAA